MPTRSTMRTICALCAAALTTVPAAAQQGEPAAPAAANWVINCPSQGQETRCMMFQRLVVAPQGGQARRLLGVRVQPDAAAGDYVLMLALPHGLYLPAGAEIAIDGGAPRTLEIRTSDAAGVYAAAPLEADLLDALRAGSQMTVSAESALRARFSVAVSLAGFSGAYDRVTLDAGR